MRFPRTQGAGRSVMNRWLIGTSGTGQASVTGWLDGRPIRRHPSEGCEVIDVLGERDGVATVVTLADGLVFRVHNIAWGYNTDDPYAHLTTNVSPIVTGRSGDFFFTDEIARIAGPTGKVLYENPSASRRSR